MRTAPAEVVISSRLLVLQSKRLLLASAQRRLNQTGSTEMSDRVDRLRRETASADDTYRSTVLQFAPAEHPDYWPVAYGRLAEVGTRLADKLRSVAAALPQADRYRASADVEILEGMLDGWTDAARSAVSSA